MFIIKDQSLKYKRNQLIKPCFYKKCSYMFVCVHMEIYIYTRTQAKSPITNHFNHFYWVQEVWASLPASFGMHCNKWLQIFCASASIARKSEIVGNQSQGDLFQQQAGPGLSTALHQLKEWAFLLPELTHCYRQNKPAEIKDYSCDLFLCSRAECTVKFHHFTWLAFWKVKKPRTYINF